MAQEFIIQPAPVIAKPFEYSPSVEEFSRRMEEGKEILQKLTIAADDYYICLIDLNSQDAREFVSKTGQIRQRHAKCSCVLLKKK